MFVVNDQVRLRNGVAVWTVDSIWESGLLTLVRHTGSVRRLRYAVPLDVVKVNADV